MKYRITTKYETFDLVLPEGTFCRIPVPYESRLAATYVEFYEKIKNNDRESYLSYDDNVIAYFYNVEGIVRLDDVEKVDG